MPKAGIHAHALDELEVGAPRRRSRPRGPASRAKVTSETPSATSSARGRRASPSRLGDEQQRSAPMRQEDDQAQHTNGQLGSGAQGRAQVTAPGSSPAPARRPRTATRHTCASSRSAAGAARAAEPRTSVPVPLTAPSMMPASTRLPQHRLGHAPQRLHDDRVVQLVDVVLVQQQRVDGPGARREAVGRCGSSGRRTRPCRCRGTRATIDTPISVQLDGSRRRRAPRRRAPCRGRAPWPACRGLGRAVAVRLHPHGAPCARRMEAGCEERLDGVAAAERVRHADVAGERPSRRRAGSAESPSPAARRAGGRDRRARPWAPWPWLGGRARPPAPPRACRGTS